MVKASPAGRPAPWSVFVLQRRPSRWTGTVTFVAAGVADGSASLSSPPSVSCVGLAVQDTAWSGADRSGRRTDASAVVSPRSSPRSRVNWTRPAIVDGAGPFPAVLARRAAVRPAHVTLTVTQSVAIFTDLYQARSPSARQQERHVRSRLLPNLQSQFNTSHNPLFMNILLIAYSRR